MNIAPDQSLKDRLSHSLSERYGQLVGGAELASLLGFRSTDTLRKAITNKTLDLRTFTVPGRHGRFALTLDVADWLSALRSSADLDDSANE